MLASSTYAAWTNNNDETKFTAGFDAKIGDKVKNSTTQAWLTDVAVEEVEIDGYTGLPSSIAVEGVFYQRDKAKDSR